MGEAKRKLEVMRASMLKDIERWSFPSTDWETAVVAEVSELNVIMVERDSNDKLAWERMKPQECHANARFMEENYPQGKIRRVLGWRLQQGQFVLHSVIQQGSTLMCVTPSPFSTENPFPFITDDKIEEKEENEQYHYYRNGHLIGPGVRSDPAAVIRQGETLRALLESGMHPHEALRRVPQSMGK